MVHVLLKPGLEIFENYFASMWDECKCVVVWILFGIAFLWNLTSLVAQMVKRLPTMRETRVWSLGWEDTLEKEIATHSSTLSGKSHGWICLVGYSPWGHKELDTTEQLHFTSLHFFGTGMKTDLFQCCGHCWAFQICWHIECNTFTTSSFKVWNSSTGIPSPPLALFIVMLSKAHLTLHSRKFASRWVITPSWLSGSWRSFCIVLLCILSTSS